MRRRAEKRRVSNRSSQRKRWHDGLRPETKKSVLAVVFFALALITVLAYWGRAGFLGGWLAQSIEFLVGSAYFLVPLTALIAGFSFLFGMRRHIYSATFIGSGLFLVSGLALTDLFFKEKSGGWLGFLTNWPLEKVFDFWAALVIETAMLAISILVVANIPLWKPRQKETGMEAEAGAMEKAIGAVSQGVETIKEAVAKKTEAPQQTPSSVVVEAVDKEAEEKFVPVKKRAKKTVYAFPPLELLNDDRSTPSSGDIRANANIIKRTLLNFGIDVEMGEVSVGPTVTQYTLKPAEGVKLSRILALHNDLALALAAHPIRIEAPIPGKSLVGIEVPNRSIALVGLRSLLENEIFQKSQAELLFALGRDVAGNPVYANLGRMPHLLVAGSTGSGKSIMLHSMISAFLYRHPPELLKFLIVDPKRVELSAYNGIPHLLTPPITEAKKTIQALRWAVKEMEERYSRLAQAGVRDLVGYNERLAQGSPSTSSGRTPSESAKEEVMPYLIIIIDELADLMAAFPREVEASIIRLAQMARAVGIHLVVSTQRPSVEVITGLIKANITSRIAFQVASQIDSRTILDVAGAEKLLGNGDMLFLAGDTAKPRRIQGGFVSEEEIARLTEFIRQQGISAETEEEIFEPGLAPAFQLESEFSEDEDPLYEEAKTTVIQAGKASASYLQRRLKIGYARAARLLDLMEERGVIGPGEGAKPREILIKNQNPEDGG